MAGLPRFEVRDALGLEDIPWDTQGVSPFTARTALVIRVRRAGW